jgi:hypothetical protein
MAEPRMTSCSPQRSNHNENVMSILLLPQASATYTH